MLTPSSLSVLFIIIILFIYLVRVSALRKRGSRQGSGTAQQTPLFTTEEMMRSTLPSLSALGSLPPPTFFFLTQSKLALVEEKDCLGKDVKRICLVAHQSLQQSIKYNAEERQSAPPSTPSF